LTVGRDFDSLLGCYWHFVTGILLLAKGFMTNLEWLFTYGAFGFISLALLNLVRTTRQKQRLRDAFYYLIETHDGCISLIELATLARVDAEPAKGYLEDQARVFSVLPEVDKDGNTFYQFPKIQRSLPVPPEDSW
jgi:hypothetical protein